MDTFGERTSKMGSAAGRKRQQILANILAPSTWAFMERVKLYNKKKILDLGCGTGETTLLLRTIMGQESQITGLDSNESQLEIARGKIQKNELSGIKFHYQNNLEWNESHSYDLVFSRQFFEQLKAPSNMLQKVFNSLKPGGMLMVEALDYSKFQCFPNSYAFERFVELYTEIIKRQGANPFIGQQCLELFQQVGLINCQIQLVRPKFLRPKNKSIASLTLENISSLLEKEKLASPVELQVLLAELKSFEEQKNTMITLPGIYQVSGHKPK